MGKIETLDLDGARIKLREFGLGMDKTTIANGIEQGVFPFGVCIRNDNGRVFKIFDKLLDIWIAERAVGE